MNLFRLLKIVPSVLILPPRQRQLSWRPAKIHPMTPGKGKKLFENGTIPAAFTLIESSVTPSGVIIANYKRAGKVMTGTVGS